MKKIFSLIICLALITLLFVSCQGSESAKVVSMYDLSKAMTSASDKLASMAYVSSSDSDADELMSSVAEVDYSEIESFFISYAENGAESADEIVVIATKNSDYVQTVKEQLQNHLDYRISLYKIYGAEQLPKLEEAKLFVSGNYIVLIIADEAESISEAFYNFTK